MLPTLAVTKLEVPNTRVYKSLTCANNVSMFVPTPTTCPTVPVKPKIVL